MQAIWLTVITTPNQPKTVAAGAGKHSHSVMTAVVLAMVVVAVVVVKIVVGAIITSSSFSSSSHQPYHQHQSPRSVVLLGSSQTQKQLWCWSCKNVNRSMSLHPRPVDPTSAASTCSWAFDLSPNQAVNARKARKAQTSVPGLSPTIADLLMEV